MENNKQFLSYLTPFFLERKMFRAKFVAKLEIRILRLIILFRK